MPLMFLNGGSPDYTGFTFSTSTDLLDQITFGLINAGWALVSETLGVTSVLEATSIDNAHKAYVQFTVKVNAGKTNGRYLVIRGWHTGSPLVTGSPDDITRLEFIETGTNRLWLSADDEAGAISIFSSDSVMAGAHYGFLNRVDKTDQWAWMVGYIYSRGYEFAYSAKAKHNDANWRLLIDDFYWGTNLNEYRSVQPFSTYDFTMQGKPRDGINDGNTTNAFRSAYLGRLNYDGKVVARSYFYTEGRGSTGGYGYRSPLYFRGIVKFAYTGFAAVAAADWIVDPESGFRIMSVGGSQWQGMRIA